jgi:hypothetical protein
MDEQFCEFQNKFKAIFSEELDQMTLSLIDTQVSQQTFQQLTSSRADF